VAQQRTVATGENGAQTVPLAADPGMSHGVDSAVQLVEPPGLDGAAYRGIRVAESQQLLARYDAMALRGQLSKSAVRSYFPSHTGVKLDRSANSPPSPP